LNPAAAPSSSTDGPTGIRVQAPDGSRVHVPVTDMISNVVEAAACLGAALGRVIGNRADVGAVAAVRRMFKAADTAGSDTRGHDGAEKTNGRNRFILTDTSGLPVAARATPARIRHRAGATAPPPGSSPASSCRTLFADQGVFRSSGGPGAARTPSIVVHIVTEPAKQRGSAAGSGVRGSGRDR